MVPHIFLAGIFEKIVKNFLGDTQLSTHIKIPSPGRCGRRGGSWALRPSSELSRQDRDVSTLTYVGCQHNDRVRVRPLDVLGASVPSSSLSL